ncbi:MAG: alpha-amylase family glycosyl hydrolase, partial [Pseudomonadota bacterium]
MKQTDSNIFSVIVLSSLLLLTSCIPREEATPFDKPPAWAKEAIWYQISVHSLDTGEQQNVIDKLDFIQSLGVNAIHINTISKSSYSEEPPISARSSITSADALFLELVQGAKQRNIKVMLDYSLQEGSLDQIRQHIFAGARRWLAPNSNGDPSDGVDGYSVDFTSALPMDFWREYRTLVRGLNPNAYLVGKMQAHSQSQQWSDELMDSSLLLQGDVFDAVVYDRSFSVARRFFANVENGISASDLVNQLDALTSGYSSDFLYASINSSAGLNTRGIVRAFSDSDNAINHPQPTLEGEHGNGNHDKETHARAKAFLAFQFTQPGAPIISVGDVVKSDKSLVTFY